MSNTDLAAKVREKAKDGKIACHTALALAEELGVSPRDIGAAANQEKIKIAACQLGCFK